MDEFRVIETPAEFDDAVRGCSTETVPSRSTPNGRADSATRSAPTSSRCIRRGSGTFLFDPPQIPDFAALQSAIRADEWVLHAASQDLACLREVGLDPDRIFDTELAARLLGMPRVGLASVVEELLGIKLAKEHSAADWSTRPLPQSWLKYAALDVELLVDVRDRLAERARRDRQDRLRRSGVRCRAAPRARSPRAAEPWRRLSGIHAMRSPRNLAVARELWLARDALAVELDIAPGRLVPDASILAAARTLPSTRRALADMRDFTGRASRTRARSVVGRDRARPHDHRAARRAGAAMTRRRRPERGRSAIPRPTPVCASRSGPSQRLAESFDMPIENLLTPDLLRRVAWSPPPNR